MSNYDGDVAAARYEDPENLRPAGPAERPKRPARRLGKHVPVRFPEALINEIRGLADRDGMTVSAWIRHVVTREVQRRRPRPTTANRAGGLEFQFGQTGQYPKTSAVKPEQQYLGFDPSAYAE